MTYSAIFIWIISRKWMLSTTHNFASISSAFSPLSNFSMCSTDCLGDTASVRNSSPVPLSVLGSKLRTHSWIRTIRATSEGRTRLIGHMIRMLPCSICLMDSVNIKQARRKLASKKLGASRRRRLNMERPMEAIQTKIRWWWKANLSPSAWDQQTIHSHTQLLRGEEWVIVIEIVRILIMLTISVNSKMQ